MLTRRLELELGTATKHEQEAGEGDRDSEGAGDEAQEVDDGDVEVVEVDTPVDDTHPVMPVIDRLDLGSLRLNSNSRSDVNNYNPTCSRDSRLPSHSRSSQHSASASINALTDGSHNAVVIPTPRAQEAESELNSNYTNAMFDAKLISNRKIPVRSLKGAHSV